MEVTFPFFSRKDFKGVSSSPVYRPRKQFEAAVDKAVGDRVRSDGACGADLWSALTNVEWRGPEGQTVSYSFRTAGDLVAWVREEGDYIDWLYGEDPGMSLAGLAVLLRRRDGRTHRPNDRCALDWDFVLGRLRRAEVGKPDIRGHLP